MNFKTELVGLRFADMLPRTQELAQEMDSWFQANFQHEITLTETATTAVEDRALNRKSDTHRTGRAFDIRTHDLTEDMIAQFCAYFRKKYPALGAFAGGQLQLIVWKPHGSGPHLHIQIRRKPPGA